MLGWQGIFYINLPFVRGCHHGRADQVEEVKEPEKARLDLGWRSAGNSRPRRCDIRAHHLVADLQAEPGLGHHPLHRRSAADRLRAVGDAPEGQGDGAVAAVRKSLLLVAQPDDRSCSTAHSAARCC
jgi:hypothetical protein